ncbi:sigma-70 family RNA polymerase sigma factor [Streptomyces xinghaiensis]|uniref:sigma-70 family RNA polymerase sigma factor n=1 Tax=Streptomyces xinghaiensis TaxID=1038928 RepID=UPI003C2E6452
MSDLVATYGKAGTATAGETAGPGGPGSEERLERHRVELTGYCYRMLGSAFDAEDAVQEVMVRAWKGLGRFEGRASLRTWLYRIATNVCLDLLKGNNRRARPMDLSSPQSASTPLPEALPETAWVEPAPDGRVLESGGDPADVAVARDTVRLAFVAALQHLPPRQRAVLILREVLAWKASEVAELLDTTVASVNSALQRARSTIEATGADATETVRPLDEAQRALLERYVDAFQRYDLDALTALLHEDARLSMPPYPLWLRGHAEIRAWMLGTGIGCRGSRLLPVTANGCPAFGQYRPAADGHGYELWALQVIEISDGRITGLNAFLDTPHLFPLFGLPPRLGPDGSAPGPENGVQTEEVEEAQQLRPGVPQP